MGRQLFRETLSRQNAQKAGRYWAHRFGLLAVIIVGVICFFSVLMVTPDPKVVLLDSDQTHYLHPFETYQQAAATQFGGSLLNRDKLTIDSGGITAALKQQFPELSVVSIELPLVGHRPIVYIQPAKAELVLVTTDAKSYVVDETGRAIGGAVQTTAEALGLTNLSDQSGTPVHISQQIIPKDTAGFIQTLLYQMGQKSIGVSTLVLPAGKSELDMHIKGQQYLVKFNLQSGTALQQIGTFLAVKHNLDGRGITPGQYIDVRVDGRAYYK